MVESAEEPEIEEEDLDKEERKQQTIMKRILSESRHLENIEPYRVETHCWRLKDRMKTVSVALVLCLNIPVDPPDVVKLQPCARLEAWVDPQMMPPRTAIETIGNNLQKAYERWQPKARYKCSRDPTGDDIKKLCTSLRRNAKEERVLFHYNGHGVPRPTDNGEIWVFNSNYTQYIPLYIYDLQQWMGKPSIYVYDCSHAGKIVNLFKSFSNQDESKCIQLAACGERELLPMNPDLPADLFTACLTTPVKMAIKYYMFQKKKRFLPGLTLEMLDKIPGQLSDRRSMLGELNWIFTAITDTIAWNTLPRDLFQKLFRQDLLVASLFRNFLLAQRVMRSYNCTPVSSPALPVTNQHPMWGAWDLAVELSLSQLPRILSQTDPGSAYRPSPFFEEQLTSFQVWLDMGSISRSPPEQLPIVLQVLLSQVYRPRALELLGTFLGLGPWAVNLVLEVGIFPYILKLLQSTAKELRPLLTLLWAKILAVDPQCKADLVRENGNKYFSNVLKDTSLHVEYRTMAAFVMCSLVSDGRDGTSLGVHGSILPLCLELVLDGHAPLRQWACICAARTWDLYPTARWEATRDNAPDKLLALLDDPVPEVRSSAVYALGTFIKSLPLNDRSDQGRLINHKIAVSLKNKMPDEVSPLVRQEILVALHYIVIAYENSFKESARQYYREFSDLACDSLSSKVIRSVQDLSRVAGGKASPSPSLNRSRTKTNISNMILLGSSPVLSGNDYGTLFSPQGMRKTGSSMSLSSFGMSSLSHEHMYMKVWHCIVVLECDPDPNVSALARKVTAFMKNKIMSTSHDGNEATPRDTDTPDRGSQANNEDGQIRSRSTTPLRKMSAPTQETEKVDEFADPIVATKFLEWCSNYFMRSSESNADEFEEDTWLLTDRRTSSLKGQNEEKWTLGLQRLEEQRFMIRNNDPCGVMLFHPIEPLLISGHDHHVAVWDIENDTRVSFWENVSNGHGHHDRISSLAILNPGTSSCYLCVGGRDGRVRIWNRAFKGSETVASRTPTSRNRSYSSGSLDAMDGEIMDNPQLITAFNAFEENNYIRKDGIQSSFLMSWEQETSCLVACGNGDKIRLWTLEEEKKLLDIAAKGGPVTAVHSMGSWIAAGFNDGYLRLFDRRISSPLVREWKDHSHPIITTQIFNSSSTSAHIICGAASGEVRLCDLRRSGSVQVLQPGSKIQCMSCHPKAHLFAVGTRSQQISVYHTSGSGVNSIRYYTGLMGQKIGLVNSLVFHPSKVLLASSTKEGTVAVHGLTKKA